MPLCSGVLLASGQSSASIFSQDSLGNVASTTILPALCHGTEMLTFWMKRLKRPKKSSVYANPSKTGAFDNDHIYRANTKYIDLPLYIYSLAARLSASSNSANGSTIASSHLKAIRFPTVALIGSLLASSMTFHRRSFSWNST